MVPKFDLGVPCRWSQTNFGKSIVLKPKMFSLKGGRCQVVKAVDCDSSIRGFDSRRSP